MFPYPPAAERAARAAIARVEALCSHHDPVHAGLRVRWRRFEGAQAPASSLPPLLLLHGGHGSWMHWLRNVDALCRDRTVWVPDMPGFHDSATPPAAALGQAQTAPLLEPLLATLDALVGSHTAIDVAGFSFGGLVAALLAARRGHVRRLALVGSAGHGTARRQKRDMVNWRAAADRSEEIAALHHNLATLLLHHPASIDALAFAIHDISCHGTRFKSRESSRTPGALQAALAASPIPQLLAWGEHDVTADVRPLAARLAQEHAQRECVVLDGAGHWAQYERADATNELLSRWFAA